MGENTIKQSYVICTTPRSGSSLLTQILDLSGVASQPDEYFTPVLFNSFVEERPGGSFGEYLNRVISEQTDPNGLFGFKLMEQDFSWLIDKLSESTGFAQTLPKYEILSEAFSNPKYIWLTRRNKIRQAISHWKAVNTNVWTKKKGEENLPQSAKYNFREIDKMLFQIILSEARWQEYFAKMESCL